MRKKKRDARQIPSRKNKGVEGRGRKDPKSATRREESLLTTKTLNQKGHPEACGMWLHRAVCAEGERPQHQPASQEKKRLTFEGKQQNGKDADHPVV